MFRHTIELHTYELEIWNNKWLRPNIPYYRYFDKQSFKQRK